MDPAISHAPDPDQPVERLRGRHIKSCASDYTFLALHAQTDADGRKYVERPGQILADRKNLHPDSVAELLEALCVQGFLFPDTERPERMYLIPKHVVTEEEGRKSVLPPDQWTKPLDTETHVYEMLLRRAQYTNGKYVLENTVAITARFIKRTRPIATALLSVLETNGRIARVNHRDFRAITFPEMDGKPPVRASDAPPEASIEAAEAIRAKRAQRRVKITPPESEERGSATEPAPPSFSELPGPESAACTDPTHHVLLERIAALETEIARLTAERRPKLGRLVFSNQERCIHNGVTWISWREIDKAFSLLAGSPMPFGFVYHWLERHAPSIAVLITNDERNNERPFYSKDDIAATLTTIIAALPL